MDISIGLGSKEILIKDVVKCKSVWSKLRGLMFGNDNKPLLFVFGKKGRYAIHSFFVRKKFVAIWMLNKNVIDARIVNPWKFYICPEKEFDTLVEIPLGSEKFAKDFSSVLEKGLYTS